jgi:hypothetical protein
MHWAWLRKFIAKSPALELWGYAKEGAWGRFKAMQKVMQSISLDPWINKMREGVSLNMG